MTRIALLILLTLATGGCTLGRAGERARWERRSYGQDAIDAGTDPKRCDCGHPECGGYHSTTTLFVVHDEEG
jgi:hypothetical protein